MPADYYVGNGVYKYLAKCKYRNNFFWTSGHLWLLVYGDKNSGPKVLTVASENKLGIKTTAEERNAVRVAQQITKGTSVSVNFVRFDPDKDMKTVQYWEPGMRNIPEISSEELKEKMTQYGLKMNKKMSHKSINDKSSSPYHDWQRENMGDSVVVADIDLIRYKNNNPAEIIELKRSYIDIDQWRPYQQDYKNFFLLADLAQERNMKFFIVYNRRSKVPFFDDVSRLKIFEFIPTNANNCRLHSIMSERNGDPELKSAIKFVHEYKNQKPAKCRLLGCKTIEQFAKSTTKEQK